MRPRAVCFGCKPRVRFKGPSFYRMTGRPRIARRLFLWPLRPTPRSGFCFPEMPRCDVGMSLGGGVENATAVRRFAAAGRLVSRARLIERRDPARRPADGDGCDVERVAGTDPARARGGVLRRAPCGSPCG